MKYWGLPALITCTFAFSSGIVVGQGIPEVVSAEGTLDGIGNDRLKLKGEDGTEYFVALDPRTELRYLGTADATFLRPGVMVRFAADFDTQKQIPTDPVDRIEIFRASRGRMSREQRLNQTPGIYPVPKDENADPGKGNTNGRAAAKVDPSIRNRASALGRNRTQGTSRARNQDQVAEAGPQKFKVIGQVRMVQAKKLQVLAGRQAVVIDLAEEPEVLVASGDTLFCQPGDEVKVTGLRTQGQEWIRAQVVEIVGNAALNEVLQKAMGGSRSKSDQSKTDDQDKSSGKGRESKNKR